MFPFVITCRIGLLPVFCGGRDLNTRLYGDPLTEIADEKILSWCKSAFCRI